MIKKEERRLRIGVLGAGPIAQLTHFECAVKARNAELYAVCDVAEDLCSRMAVAHGAEKTYFSYDKMLDDPQVDAVIVATSDAFHVEASKMALAAGKHVLCEKPLGVSVEEVESLRAAVKASGKVLQVGHMRRFDPGIQSARDFIQNGMGALFAFKAWYCDSTHRYTNTDAIQPAIVTSKFARKPAENPKADLKRYLMLAHGCHLIDLSRFLAGDFKAVLARYTERAGMRGWFVDVEFVSGAMGHLDLSFAVRMDWHEGFQIYGQNGSVLGKMFNPWYYRSSEVDVFREATASSERVLGPDGHFYRRQLEGFADVILNGANMTGASVDDGVASVRGMVAIARSAASGTWVAPDSVTGGL